MLFGQWSAAGLLLGRLEEGQSCRDEACLDVSGLNESVKWDSKDLNS